MDRAISLCTVWGEKQDMLPHFISHYQNLGVSNFNFVVHAREENDPYIVDMTEALSQYDIKPAVYVGAWNGVICTNLINEVKAKRPDDWFLVADQDELQLYPEPLQEVIGKSESNGLYYVTGAFVDRLGKEGSLVGIDKDQSIWSQFPNCGFVSFPLAGANPYKITLCKGNVTLAEGQHGVVVPEDYYPVTGPVVSQVHHFKWDASLIDRLNARLLTNQMGDWKDSYEGYSSEVESILKYLAANENKISITEPLFLIDQAKGNYNDYKHWSRVKETLSTWSNLQAYPRIGM